MVVGGRDGARQRSTPSWLLTGVIATRRRGGEGGGGPSWGSHRRTFIQIHLHLQQTPPSAARGQGMGAKGTHRTCFVSVCARGNQIYLQFDFPLVCVGSDPIILSKASVCPPKRGTPRSLTRYFHGDSGGRRAWAGWWMSAWRSQRGTGRGWVGWVEITHNVGGSEMVPHPQSN